MDGEAEGDGYEVETDGPADGGDEPGDEKWNWSKAGETDWLLRVLRREGGRLWGVFKKGRISEAASTASDWH
jgi:hypothetical protein